MKKWSTPCTSCGRMTLDEYCGDCGAHLKLGKLEDLVKEMRARMAAAKKRFQSGAIAEAYDALDMRKKFR